jgi:membrane protein YdbS with pleckstrin-like domain
MTENEVLVNKGIITKTNKIVPFRTITNIELHRGPFDRYFSLSTIDVQTAGSSGQGARPEEQLIGLHVEDAEAIQQLLKIKIKRLQGTPATSLDPDTNGKEEIRDLINEVVAIRKLIESKIE